MSTNESSSSQISIPFFPKLNFNGFSTRVYIDEEKMSATDVSLSASENLITFEGAYGGDMNYGETRNYLRFNTPSFYELPDVSCSINAELTYKQIKTHFFDWLYKREKEKRITIGVGSAIKSSSEDVKPFSFFNQNLSNDVEKFGMIDHTFDMVECLHDNVEEKTYKSIENETFDFKNCYFKSIKLSASENSLLTANYDFLVLSNGVGYEELDEYPDELQSSDSISHSYSEEELRENKKPVGFWETAIKGFEFKNEEGNFLEKHVSSWDLNINQNVITKYYCGRIGTEEINSPVLPDVMIGYPKMELSVNFVIDREKFNKDVFKIFEGNSTVYVYDESSSSSQSSSSTTEDVKTLSLWIRGKEFCRFKYGRVTTYSPSINTRGAITFSASFLINQIILF